jgi:uncharacterized protein YjbI with pentapeptide repeats
MANPEHLQILAQGVEAWNKWRDQDKDTRADLRDTNLRDTNLRGVNFFGANLAGADLTGATIEGANLAAADLTGATIEGASLPLANLMIAHLSEANLSAAKLNKANLNGTILCGANLAGAWLMEVNLAFADLSDANLAEANLASANLTGANLANTNLSEAKLRETVFGNTNLTTVQGLETCHHHGPSILDHRTLTLSGQLPLAFLQGCGLSDWEIEATKLYDQSLTPGHMIDLLYRIHHLRTDPLIQFYSCFLSYNHTDVVFARSLHDRLQRRGIRCWLDVHQMLPGDDLYTYIDRGIQRWDKILLCCSSAALTTQN